jgi:hypothetical protein
LRLGGPFQLDRFLDLEELELDERVVLLSVGVVSSQDHKGFLLAAFGNEPPRRLWDEEERACDELKSYSRKRRRVVLFNSH